MIAVVLVCLLVLAPLAVGVLIAFSRASTNDHSTQACRTAVRSVESAEAAYFADQAAQNNAHYTDDLNVLVSGRYLSAPPDPSFRIVVNPTTGHAASASCP